MFSGMNHVVLGSAEFCVGLVLGSAEFCIDLVLGSTEFCIDEQWPG